VQQILGDVGLAAKLTTVGPRHLSEAAQGRPDEAGDVSYFRWSCGCQDANGTLFPLFDSSSQ
jgi:peptide/nickel transport system substrate-binding protein